MLQSSFNLIRQHFGPNSTFQKNIFLTKDYDYPNNFIQKLYLSYLQIQQFLKSSSTQEIIKRINLVSNKNDTSFQNTILGIIYGIVLNTGNTKLQRQKSNDYEKQLQKPNSSQMITKKQDTIKFSQHIIKQIQRILPLFRAEAWTLFNNITITLVMTHYHEIKPIYRLGLIALFEFMQLFESNSDNLFILMIKTLNFYDQRTSSIKYNLLLLSQLQNVLKQPQQVFDQLQRKNDSLQNKSLNLKVKRDEQISLMRLYLFGKLVEWQYLINRMRLFMKGEWAFHLQRLCVQSLKLLKLLFCTNPDQCLVFSVQLLKYISYSTSDAQLQQIFKRIKQYPPIKTQMLSHHYSLVPLSVQMMIPLELEQSLNQLEYIMSSSDHNKEPKNQKSSIFMSLGWIWRQLNNKFSGELRKSILFIYQGYLLENVLPDIVRWAVTSNGRNIQFKTVLVQWVMYQCPENQMINKLIKQSFFQDLFYYLRNSHKVSIQNNIQIDLEHIFPILSVPLYILNCLCFSSPQLAEQLFIMILSRLSNSIYDHSSGLISEQVLKSQVNHVLYKASIQGILRINEMIYHSHVGNQIKNELQIRIKQAEQKETKRIGKIGNQDLQMGLQEQLRQKSRPDIKSVSIKPQKEYYVAKPEAEYYGGKDVNIEFNINEKELGQQEQDLIYSSHQLIPSSPSYEQIKDPQFPNTNHLQAHQFTLENDTHSFKRDNQISTYELQQQIQQHPQLTVKNQNQHQISSLQTNKKSQPNKNYEVQLQKQFYQQMGSEVNSLLNDPTVLQFAEYMKQLTKTLKDYKKTGQQELIIETFLQQTSKILYLAFNHQFQSFNITDQDPQQPKQSRLLTYFLLKSINHNWKHSISIYQVFLYKKIVKTLSESFPSCQFAFYLAFLDTFKKGVPHFREMKTWLIQKERQKFVIPVLQKILGKKFKIHLYQNAQALKIQ